MRLMLAGILVVVLTGCASAGDRDALVRSELAEAGRTVVLWASGAASSDGLESVGLPDTVMIDRVDTGGEIVARLSAAGRSGACYAVDVVFPTGWIVDGSESPAAGDVITIAC